MPHLITADRIIGKFPVPTGGVNQLMPSYELTPSQLRDSSNVFPRNGVLRPRPGLLEQAAYTFTGTPTGIFDYIYEVDASAPILATTTNIYIYADLGAGPVWSDVTGAAFSTSPVGVTKLARFTTIVIGTPEVNYVVHTNGKITPRFFNGATGTFTNVTGNPPKWSDICTVQDHVIGIVPPYALRWGDILSLTSWPALNVQQVAQTPDRVVAIRPIGQGGTAVLYKERSYYYVNYTGAATEAAAFSVQLIGFFDGPASPAAVVDVNGSHVLMTATGRIGVFSGSRMEWVGDLLWPVLRADIDPTKARRIFGVYDKLFQEVTFVYPSLANGSEMTGAVILTIPNPAVGRNESGVFPCTLSSGVSAGGNIRGETDFREVALMAGTSANRMYEWTTDADQDDTTDFGGHWQTGLIATPGMDPFRLEAMEVFAERGTGYGRLTVQPVTSWTLAGEGTLGEALVGEAGNLERPDEPIRAATGFPVQARFFGLRCSFAAAHTTQVRYKGASVFALRKST